MAPREAQREERKEGLVTGRDGRGFLTGPPIRAVEVLKQVFQFFRARKNENLKFVVSCNTDCNTNKLCTQFFSSHRPRRFRLVSLFPVLCCVLVFVSVVLRPCGRSSVRGAVLCRCCVRALLHFSQ